MENRSFGQYIIQLRDKKSISQRKLAELAGVTNSTISRIEADMILQHLRNWHWHWMLTNHCYLPNVGIAKYQKSLSS